MSEALDTYQKLNSCTEAFKSWCQSQDLIPGDAVMLCEWFIACMILENAETHADIEYKVKLSDSTLRKFILTLRLTGSR